MMRSDPLSASPLWRIAPKSPAASALRISPEASTDALSRSVIARSGSVSLVRSQKDGGKGILKQIPLKSFATVEEVAKVVSFLAGPDSSYVTGSLLTVDGGVGSQLGVGAPL